MGSRATVAFAITGPTKLRTNSSFSADILKYSWCLSASSCSSLTRWQKAPCSFRFLNISCTQNLCRLLRLLSIMSCMTRSLCLCFPYKIATNSSSRKSMVPGKKRAHEEYRSRNPHNDVKNRRKRISQAKKVWHRAAIFFACDLSAEKSRVWKC